MNTADLARSAYTKAKAPLSDTRSQEYEIFARVTSALVLAKSEDFPRKAEALHNNSKLWNALTSDLAHPNNKLPRDLRARLFFLAEFTFALTRKALQENADFTALIDINTAMMRGLKGQPVDEVQ